MFSIESFVAECVDAVAREGPDGGRAVADLIGRAVSTPDQIRAEVGDLAAIERFTAWHVSDDLTILHVVWPPTADLIPHDHRMWASIGLYGGREDNRYWRRTDDGSLEQAGGRTLRAGDVGVLGHDVVHSVTNPGREWTGSIHTYGGDYFATERSMWPEAARPPVPFDPSQVQERLDEAARRAASIS